MVRNAEIFGICHNDDGSVTVQFRTVSETYSDKKDLDAIVVMKREQKEARERASTRYPDLLS